MRIKKGIHPSSAIAGREKIVCREMEAPHKETSEVEVKVEAKAVGDWELGGIGPWSLSIRIKKITHPGYWILGSLGTWAMCMLPWGIGASNPEPEA